MYYVLKAVQWQGLSVGYGSNANRLMMGVRVEWIGCHSDHKYIHQKLLRAIINYLSLSNEGSNHHLHQKNLNVLFVFADTVARYHQCRAAACVTLLKFVFLFAIQ